MIRPLRLPLSLLLLAATAASPLPCRAQSDKPSPSIDIAGALAPIRDAAHLPAMAGAIVSSRGLVASGVVGMRRIGSDQAATIQDQWHLGSDTKAMTATVIGLIVDYHMLRFDSTLGEIFPDLAPALPDALRKVTVEMLLSHRAGLPHDPDGGWDRFIVNGSLMQQRRAVVKAAGKAILLAPPGTAYNYSNWDYVILGAVIEKYAEIPWEEVVRTRVFEPLGMRDVGFGGSGTFGKVDQPWPHQSGVPMPNNGPTMDNRPVMAPAGEVHCPIGEWAKFIANELRGLRGEPNLLTPATFKRLHTPAFGGSYAGGWSVVSRGWARGTAYAHNGTNTMNYASAWMAPNRDVAFLVCTNDGDGAEACDKAINAMIRLNDRRAP